MRWKTSKTSCYNIAYHLIWCPKYRKKILINEIETELKKLLKEKADELGVVIETMEVMPDHVHLFVRSNPIIPVQQLVYMLKGYTSRHLRTKFPTLKSRLPCLWTRSYFCETTRHISEEIIKKYIEQQKTR